LSRDLRRQLALGKAYEKTQIKLHKMPKRRGVSGAYPRRFLLLAGKTSFFFAVHS